ncbi:ABC transporter permease [Gammaproteobacteria bacterium]|nr:ABC transporter permease [Gammaproteobacteria bacterium]
MFSLPFNLAYKYFKSNKGGVFSFTSFLAISGLGIGVCSLIVVMSVMNGFEKELQDRILGVVPHAVIYSDGSIPEYTNTIKVLKENENILEAAPYISLQGLISSSSSSKGVSITGIELNAEPNMSIIPNYMVYGTLENLNEKNSIIIGSWLSSSLGVFIGDTLTVTTSDIRSSIIGSYPRSVTLKVVGIFELRAEIDQSLVLISHSLAQKLKGLKNETTSIRIKTSDLFKADEIAYKAAKSIDSISMPYYSSSWKQTHGTLFEAIQFEKLLISLMLFLIVGVASILVLSTIIMTVKSKEREIGILKTIGASDIQLILIFFYQGLMVSLIGIFIGILFGILITLNINNLILWLEQLLQRNLLEAYFINYFPYFIDANQILLICFLSFLFSIFSSLIPALSVTKLNPIEILRHE